MKKKIISFALIVLVILSITATVFAAESADESLAYSRVVDAADILDDAEESALLAKLNEMSERLGVNIAVITYADPLNGNTPDDAADYFYSQCYGETDGTLLFISMDDRDYVITSAGFGDRALTYDAKKVIESRIVGDLSAGNYARAFDTYAELSEGFVKDALDGNSYEAPKDPFNWVVRGIISIAISAVVGLIVVNVQKQGLKSVFNQFFASNYVVKDSLNLTVARERFLYSQVTYTNKAQSSSSRSGSTHTTVSGKF